MRDRCQASTCYFLSQAVSSGGLWLFHVDRFNSWNGHDYGMPNISSVQDWDHGPEKVTKTKADDARR